MTLNNPKSTFQGHVILFRRIVTFLIIAPYKYSYLLTYLLTLTQNISEMAKDTAIVTIEGE